MTSKRNAALEALSSAGFQTTSAATPRAGEGTENVVPIKPDKPSKALTRVMVYLPAKVARKFKEIAFTEDRKANEVYLDALDAFLTKQGHGGIKGIIGR